MFPIDIDFSRLKEVLTYDPQAPMIFSSGIFLWLFAAFMIVYTLLQRKYTARILFVTLFSYYFYYKSSGTYFFLLALVTVCDFLLAQWMDRTEGRWKRKGLVTLSLGVNLGLLAYFKYTNFLGGVIASLMGGEFTALDIFLPVGISFFTFQSLSYTIDVYRKDIKPLTNILDYAFYVSFFPQLVAGPIERSGNILPQLQLPARFSYERAKSGLVLMLWGYIQKMVVADRLALLADTVYAQGGALGGWATAAATVLFCFELYCDFSSYTDIARGAARILGVELMENFRSPFLSQSVAEFWRNWHISLSSFFRDYLYIPLGGSRRGLARTCVNTMVVFLCSGLWHGAAWTFVAWGLLHGLYLGCGRLTLPLRKRLYTALRVPYGCLPARLWRTAWTFALVAFSMIFFRAGGMDAALSMVRSLLRPGAFPGREAVLAWGMDGPDLLLSAVCVAAVVLCDVLRRRWGSLSARLLQKPLAVQWAVLLAGVLTVAIFGMYGEGYVEKPFIYFQF